MKKQTIAIGEFDLPRFVETIWCSSSNQCGEMRLDFRSTRIAMKAIFHITEETQVQARKILMVDNLDGLDLEPDLDYSRPYGLPAKWVSLVLVPGKEYDLFDAAPEPDGATVTLWLSETLYLPDYPCNKAKVMKNSIMVLCPYLHQGLWVFDDDSVGLVREPFVAGIPDILEALLQKEGIEHPETGFRLIFSAIPFPSNQLCGHRLREENGGNWYGVNTTGGQLEGWLCPALFKYFEAAPDDLYIRVETLMK